MKTYIEGNYVILEKGIESVCFRLDDNHRIKNKDLANICKTLLRSGVELNLDNLKEDKYIKNIIAKANEYSTIIKELKSYRDGIKRLRDVLLVDSYDIEDKLKPEEYREALFSYISKRPSKLMELLY